MRRISFALTQRQLLNGSKDVTRRLGWRNLSPGQPLLAVSKCMDAPARVLVADPPWQHKDPGIRCGTKRHYRTLSTSEICTFDLPPLAADCWLWLWCTHNHHADAHQVAAAWGFDRYRSEGVWVKTSASGQPRIGGGHTLRQCHEKFLLFSRGKPERIDKGLPSAIIAPHPRGADKRILHSAKPDEFYELVKRFSEGPRVELFARQHRPGFECFGDELPTPGAA